MAVMLALNANMCVCVLLYSLNLRHWMEFHVHRWTHTHAHQSFCCGNISWEYQTAAPKFQQPAHNYIYYNRFFFSYNFHRRRLQKLIEIHTKLHKFKINFQTFFTFSSSERKWTTTTTTTCCVFRLQISLSSVECFSVTNFISAHENTENTLVESV